MKYLLRIYTHLKKVIQQTLMAVGVLLVLAAVRIRSVRASPDEDAAAAAAAFLAASSARCLALLALFRVVRRVQACVPGFGLYF